MRTLLAALPALAAGCMPTCPEVTASSTGFAHAVDLSWTTSRETVATLRYGPEGDLQDSLAVDEAPATSHRASIFGLPSLSEIAFELRSLRGGEELVCEGSFETENLPPGLPQIQTTLYEPELASSARYLLGVVMADSAPDTVFAIDRESGYRFHLLGDTDVQSTDAHFDRLSQDILFNGVDPQHAEDISVVYSATQSGALQDATRTPFAHHVFYQHEDGTLVYPTADLRSWYDSEQGREVQVAGDTLMERAPDGTERVIWSAWDELPVEKSEGWDRGFYPTARDWTHANAVSYDEATDSYLLSLANITTLVQIARDTGETLDLISPLTYRFPDGQAPFAFQHDAQWTEDGHLLLLSHGSDGTAPIEYEIDQDAGTLRVVWTWPAVPSTSFLGQVRRLDNGNTLINYGGLGLIREVTPDGKLAWELATQVGTWFGNVVPFDDFYTGE